MTPTFDVLSAYQAAGITEPEAIPFAAKELAPIAPTLEALREQVNRAAI